MDKIKTSELVKKLTVAYELAFRCEDENFFHAPQFLDLAGKEVVTPADLIKIIRITEDFARFSSIRAICKVLQETDLIENDVDVFNNDDFREEVYQAIASMK